MVGSAQRSPVAIVRRCRAIRLGMPMLLKLRVLPLLIAMSPMPVVGESRTVGWSRRSSSPSTRIGSATTKFVTSSYCRMERCVSLSLAFGLAATRSASGLIGAELCRFRPCVDPLLDFGRTATMIGQDGTGQLAAIRLHRLNGPSVRHLIQLAVSWCTVSRCASTVKCGAAAVLTSRPKP